MMNESASSGSNNHISNDIDGVNPMHVDVDSLLAQELHQLSFERRTVIQEEIHGVPHAIEETPEMIDDALQKLQQSIEDLPIKRAYDHAVINLNSQYVTSKEFRLKFLRAELFDVPKAAIRLTKRLDLLHKYFGVIGLLRAIRYIDLTPEEQSILQDGNNQLLPSRDRAGRLVHFHHDYRPDNGALSMPVRVSSCKFCT
jgi:hypothetical protein